MTVMQSEWPQYMARKNQNAHQFEKQRGAKVIPFKLFDGGREREAPTTDDRTDGKPKT